MGAGAARVDALGEEGVHAGRVAVVEVGQQVLQVVVVVVAVLIDVGGKKSQSGSTLNMIYKSRVKISLVVAIIFLRKKIYFWLLGGS